MIIFETVVVRIGKTPNGHILRTKMAESILSKLDDVPIIWNENESFWDYNDKKGYSELPVAGKIIGNAKICGKKILADIELKDKYAHLWKGQSDNWCVTCDLNANKEMIIESVMSIEVF